MAVAGPEVAAEDVATEVVEVLLQSTHNNKGNRNTANSNSQMAHPWMNVERRTEPDLDVVQSEATDVVDCSGCWSHSSLRLCGWHNPSSNTNATLTNR